MIGYRQIGSGPQPVLVMHEWLGDHANWEPVWPYLDGERFSYVFADLRGYGWSKAAQGRYSLEEAAADVLAVMDHCGHRRFHVVGHSMSAMIAQYLLLQAPARVGGIVAICPVPASGFAADEPTLAAMKAVIDDDAAARAAIAARSGGRYGEPWLRFKLGLARRAATREAMAGYLRMFTGSDFAAEVRGNATPLLGIVGRHDIPFYREASVKPAFAALYPNFELAVCEESGHYPMLEAPVFVASRIESFVGRFDIRDS